MAMKVVMQARLELSGGSTPDLLRPMGAPSTTALSGSAVTKPLKTFWFTQPTVPHTFL